MSVPAPASAPALDLRRVTIVTPHGRYDLSVPASVPLAYLVPTVLRQAGRELADHGAAHGGWALQRLGGAPFDTALSAAALGIADGDLLYLQPRRSQLPTPVFDDAADAIGATLAEHARAWNAAAARAVGVAAAAALLLCAAAAALAAGPPWAGRALALGLSSLILLGAGALLSRAAGEAAAATVLGCGAVGHGSLAVCLAVLAHGGRLGPAVAAGAAVGLLLCALVFLAAGTGEAELTAAAVTCLAALAAGGAMAVGHGGGMVEAADGGAAGLAVAFLATPFIPTFAYRAARLPRPYLPTTADELRAGESAPSARQLAERTLRADHYVTALISGCAFITVAAGYFPAAAAGWAGPVLVALIAALSALRGRVLRGFGQRVCLAGCAALLAVELAAGLAARHHGALAGSAVVAGAALLSVPAAIGAARPGHVPTPPVARAMDVLEGLCAAAVLPVALQVLGAYGRISGLIG